ncbi:MAG: adenylate kinase [Nitrososphaerales archaeon]
MDAPDSQSGAQQSLGNRRRNVVIVGIPGVGKSTVVTKIVETLQKQGKKPRVVNYGTVMLEQAMQLHGVKSRDEMRKLPVELQRVLQIHAASYISRIDSEYLIVDTHLFIATPEGFWPGMPYDVLQALKPTHIVLVSATIDEINSRRQNDRTRARDKVTHEGLSQEIEAAKSLLFASSLVCGCPALVIHNIEGQADSTAEKVINAVFPK